MMEERKLDLARIAEDETAIDTVATDLETQAIDPKARPWTEEFAASGEKQC
jgi:hypothetical protein